MAKQTPIPQNPIGESFVWRDWFQKLSDRVFGSAAGIDVPIQPEYGGTGITTYNKGDIIYSNATDNLTRLAAPAATSVLQMTALGVPSWTIASTGTVTSVGGTGTVSGLTLSGTVTSSGNLTLGGTLDLSSPPAIGSTTPAAGTFTTLTATGQTSLGGAAGSEAFRATVVASQNRYVNAQGGVAGSTYPAVGTGGGTEKFGVYSNGNNIVFHTLGYNGTQQFNISHTTSAVNYVQVTGGATTKATVVSSAGSDSNISSVFQSKGTGAIDLAAGSRGVNISNGGTVTALTRTSAGQSYTSFPSITISAPTTSGGVQATAAVTSMTFYGSTPTVNSGGTGYTVNDVLTVASGAVGGPCTLTVTAVSGGVITAATHTTFGSLTTLPTVPYSVTGGTGTGATFTSTWQVANQSITNAGSGYVEQPTVSFSGGGGSGAAAYASVGSGVALKTLAGTLTISGSSGDVLRIYDYGGQAGIGMRGHTLSGTAPVIFPTPSNSSQTNINFQVASLGTGSIQFSTNAGLSGSGAFNQVDQLRVSHTASAVNYVQVSGGVTGGAATVQFTGSDANVLAGYFTKGSGSHSFYSAAGASRQVRIDGANASAVNYLDFYGASAGSAPSVRVGGSDTNIDLTLTPKGTGNVKFGTYTGTALSIAGYIEIKTADGTLRKLAVVA